MGKYDKKMDALISAVKTLRSVRSDLKAAGLGGLGSSISEVVNEYLEIVDDMRAHSDEAEDE
jgi:hypothetical protein